jgi:hypothetical protein
MCTTDEQTSDPKVRMKPERGAVSRTDKTGRSAGAADLDRIARSFAGAGLGARGDSEDLPTFEGLALMMSPCSLGEFEIVTDVPQAQTAEFAENTTFFCKR